MGKTRTGFGFILVASLLLFTRTAFSSQTHVLSELNNPVQDWDMSSYDFQNSGNVVLVGMNSYITFPENAQGDGFSIVFDGTGTGDSNYLYIRGGTGNPDSQSNLFRATRDFGSINAYGNMNISSSVTIGSGLTVSAGDVILPSNTIDTGEVSFNYAGSSSKGGAASGLACTDCVTLGTETTGGYAGSSSEGGDASGLACTDCVTLGNETTGGYAGSSSEGGAASGLACTDCVALGTETTGNYAGSSSEGGTATNALDCSGDSVCGVGNTVRSTDASLGVSGSGYGMEFKIDTDTGSDDYYRFYSDGVDKFNIRGNTGDVQLGGDWTTPGKVYSNKFCDVGGNICLRAGEASSVDQLYVETEPGTTKGLAVGKIYASESMIIGDSGTPEDDLHIKADTAQIKLGDGNSGPHGIIFEDNTANSGVQLFWRTTPKQLIIESSSAGTGTDGADKFVYDRDDGYFSFYENLGINVVPSYDLHVSGSMYSSTSIYVLGDVGVKTTDPQQEMDIRGSMRIDYDLDVFGDNIYSTGAVEIEDNKFTDDCLLGDTTEGVMWQSICNGADSRRIYLYQCGPSGWLTQQYWTFTDYSC